MQSMDRKPFVTSYFPANIWYLALLVTTLLLTGGGKVQAQGTDSVARRSNFAARWAVADSLRRRMRLAADEGRLLQWGDSVVRAKWGRGLTDSAQTLRRHRLQRIDSRLSHGDQLLQKRYQRSSYDTLYVVRPEGRWTVKLRANLSGARITFEGGDNGKYFSGDLKADYRGTLSVAVAYRGIAVGVAINPAKFAGKSKDNELNLNSYGNAFGFDVVYLSSKTYHGNINSDGVLSYFDKGQVRQRAVNLNAYYAFNNRRFSFPAAFSQSYIQKRSAGAVMIGVSLDGQQTDVDGYDHKGGEARLRILQLGIGVGYGYNLVLGRRWLFHLSALPTLDVLVKSSIRGIDGRVSMPYHFPSVIVTGRGGGRLFLEQQVCWTHNGLQRLARRRSLPSLC